MGKFESIFYNSLLKGSDISVGAIIHDDDSNLVILWGFFDLSLPVANLFDHWIHLWSIFTDVIHDFHLYVILNYSKFTWFVLL